ncbi:hypothetical protein [Stutzerimonas kirkiae]|uniref:cysteine dioxygenase family protein n=1 Tax=Stutzerimonas kirkiae TaxID=2211392 RepID=UPI0010383B10|nr:hypothetical protein [Stutzerimonas kirkiae]TBV10176.1 hypothetical protein DNK01_18130 [Stutzerimonas kirkiae]
MPSPERRYLSEAQHARDPQLAAFIEAIHGVLDSSSSVVETLAAVSEQVRGFLPHWRLPDARYLARQPGKRYGSYLLYRAADTRFVIVIDTFDAGQTSQIHNHRTWAVVGLIEGTERNRIYLPARALDAPPQLLDEYVTRPGEVFALQETQMHQLQTAEDALSVSFHVYGADVGTIQRLRWDEASAAYREFRQGWSNDVVDLPVYLDGSVLSEIELRRQCVGYLQGAD